MRSRYTAYVNHDVEYLLKSWHRSTRPAYFDPTTIADWRDLRIVRTEAGNAQDQHGIVEFIATALSQKSACTLHEASRFVKEENQWFYVDGDILPDPPPIRRSEKIGRNEPCPCGSGKKSKKCCGS